MIWQFGRTPLDRLLRSEHMTRFTVFLHCLFRLHRYTTIDSGAFCHDCHEKHLRTMAAIYAAANVGNNLINTMLGKRVSPLSNLPRKISDDEVIIEDEN